MNTAQEVFEAEGWTVFFFTQTQEFWVVDEFGARVFPEASSEPVGFEVWGW